MVQVTSCIGDNAHGTGSNLKSEVVQGPLSFCKVYPESIQEYILYPGNIERAIRDYVTPVLLYTQIIIHNCNATK